MSALSTFKASVPLRTGKHISILAEMRVPGAHIFIADIHDVPRSHVFQRDDVYLIDLCLTPRRTETTARFSAEWAPGRTVELGSLIAFPPGLPVELKRFGGQHASLIFELQAELVARWLPANFRWNDRCLEAVLDIASDTIRLLMVRLNTELQNPRPGTSELASAIVLQLAIELARYFSDLIIDDSGGLAAWRLKLIDQRIADPQLPGPSVAELADLCRLSPRQLRRAFRASKGCTISDHLAQRRIDRAKRRVATNESLSSIASELGFSSQATFTAAFRRITGTTPDQYRKKLKAVRGGSEATESSNRP